ncbi:MULTISPECIES: hypothetical protein [Sphingobacterium]|uniref:ABC transporter substrate-binding protein n=1 Tax=Sphingobacterium populi TaxID=1812824 RepID=A0ABW5U7T2_9SPHI|nr:hypothetical protein [Sphingobacterium sp. CFCC 11742]
MEKEREYQKLLQTLKVTDTPSFERLEEEIDIVYHKLKFISIESRPRVTLVSNIRELSQDFSALTQEALEIGGGIWQSITDIRHAEKIIVVQRDEQLYSDLPVVLQDDALAQSPAAVNNEIYVIQHEVLEDTSANGFLKQVEVFAEIVQSKYFIYGHQGQDWVQFDLR